jgi:hypothetical protein
MAVFFNITYNNYDSRFRKGQLNAVEKNNMS